MYSQAVTHPSTNTTQCCLTSVIRRELVFSTWYGPRHSQSPTSSEPLKSPLRKKTQVPERQKPCPDLDIALRARAFEIEVFCLVQFLFVNQRRPPPSFIQIRSFLLSFWHLFFCWESGPLMWLISRGYWGATKVDHFLNKKNKCQKDRRKLRI